jgi:hypothetical protein
MTIEPYPIEGGDPAVQDAEAVATTAPYMSFPGFRSLLGRLQEEGVPQVFDRHYFGNRSGSLLAQIRGTLRFFDLIDEEKRPTQALRDLVGASEQERVEQLKQLALAQYGDIVELGKENGTYGQLSERFRARGLSGATVDKAITFYLGLADYVGFPVSPFFRRGRASSGGASTAPRKVGRKRKTVTVPQVPAEASLPAQPAVRPAEVQKSAYVEMLMEMARSAPPGDPAHADLLDRIERALGMAQPSQGEGNA